LIDADLIQLELDPDSGSLNAFTVAIGYREKDGVVVDLV
jgi:hypothetical protein